MSFKMKHAVLTAKLTCGLALATFGAAGASAAPYHFHFTGGSLADTNFDVAEAIPVLNSSSNFYFKTTAIGATFGGAPATIDEFYFINSAESVSYGTVQFLLNGTQVFNFGPQLYTGSEAAPTFKLGSFALTPDPFFNGFASVTISGGAPGAPAPLLGEGLLAGLVTFGAFALTRRRRPSRSLLTSA